MKRALTESDLNISLGAEVDGCLVGAVLGSLHYCEFGLPEPIAVLDTILVDPGHGPHGIGTVLLDQLVKNLGAFGIERLCTEVAWDEHDLNQLHGRRGFAPRRGSCSILLSTGRRAPESRAPDSRDQRGGVARVRLSQILASLDALTGKGLVLVSGDVGGVMPGPHSAVHFGPLRPSESPPFFESR